jgi:hypothetical protein
VANHNSLSETRSLQLYTALKSITKLGLLFHQLHPATNRLCPCYFPITAVFIYNLEYSLCANTQQTPLWFKILAKWYKTEVPKLLHVGPPLRHLINFTSPFQNKCKQIWYKMTTSIHFVIIYYILVNAINLKDRNKIKASYLDRWSGCGCFFEQISLTP